jgi:hypothetical protein
MADYSKLNSRHLCAYCGRRLGEHGGSDNPHGAYKCPGGAFPEWPTAREKKLGTAAAEAYYDRRLVQYWTKRSTSFYPKS